MTVEIEFCRNINPRAEAAIQRNRSPESDLRDTTANQAETTLVGMLDLDVAFDCVDHGTLLGRLEPSFDLTGLVLNWKQAVYVRYNGIHIQHK